VSVNIEIEGYDRLRRKLERLGKGAYFRGALTAAASDVKSWIAEYPRATAANEPGPHPSRWYERGYGSRWTLAGGGIGGRQTSETLGRRWTTRIASDGRSAIVGNNASYAPFVQDGGHYENEREMLWDVQALGIR